jgi:hypothetical protein
VRDLSAKTIIDAARFEFWLGPDGTFEAGLGLRVSGSWPPSIEFDWPANARPTRLYLDREFRLPPEPADGRLVLSLPTGATDRLIWIAWTGTHSGLPQFSGPLAGRFPWPRQVPVENATFRLHVPEQYLIVPAATSAGARPDHDDSLVPAVLRAPKISDPAAIVPEAWVVRPVPQPGQPFELGEWVRLINLRPARAAIPLGCVFISALVCWRILPLWLWLTRNETVAWLILAAFWWLWLTPSWLGAAIAVWAIVQTFRRRRASSADFAAASTAHVPPLA